MALGINMYRKSARDENSKFISSQIKVVALLVLHNSITQKSYVTDLILRVSSIVSVVDHVGNYPRLGRAR